MESTLWNMIKGRSLKEADKAIDTYANSFGLSDWLRDNLKTALRRDPMDASDDAANLMAFCEHRRKLEAISEGGD